MQVQSGSSSLPKNEQKQRSRKACRYVRNSRNGLRRESRQTKKGYSEESRDDNAGSTNRETPSRQYDRKLLRARSWFEGVSTPRNEKIGVYGQKLRSNKHQGQVHPNVKWKIKTSPAWREREDGGICSHHTHDAGKRWSEKTSRANLQRFCELIL